jgi:hypothetical protein
MESIHWEKATKVTFFKKNDSIEKFHKIYSILLSRNIDSNSILVCFSMYYRIYGKVRVQGTYGRVRVRSA